MPSQDRRNFGGEAMGIVRVFLVLAAVAGAVAPAAAQQRRPETAQPGFRVCNQTGDEIEVAKALNTGATDGSGRIIISEGWYKLPPSACTFLWSGSLQYRYYLVYAQNKRTNREWAGKVPICVSREAFTIRSDTCGPQHDRRLFTQVDARGERHWTHTFYP
jgi:uncharacterized membrane protein